MIYYDTLLYIIIYYYILLYIIVYYCILLYIIIYYYITIILLSSNAVLANLFLFLDFCRVLVGRVQQLLHQREQWCSLDKKLWLQHEALVRGRLQETGTFRKALWQKLSSIVSPLLSEVIAYCDCNENLDLVEGGNDWKSRFWLAMMNEEQITALEYESFLSPVSRAFRERARVVCRGFGHNFKSRFPFSWLIKDTVDRLFVKVEGN